MKLILAWMTLACCTANCFAQDLEVEDILDSAAEWAEQNLDPEVLNALGGDQERFREFLSNLQTQLQGPYVLDLGALKDTAKSFLPVLESYEETFPYSLWLQTRLDFLEAAEEMKSKAQKPRVDPAKPTQALPNPTHVEERTHWKKRLEKRAWPAKATELVPRLKPIFQAQKVPPELVWIAEVESSFDPRARSPVGAAGLFQLMPPTAKRFGLRTWPIDERLNPEPSAVASAKYLKFLHERFKDWRLALAAYNAGEGTVQRALARKNARGFEAIAATLPAETQMYVPRVEATILRREGVQLEQLRLVQGGTASQVSK